MECAAAKLLLVTSVGFQLVSFIPIPFELTYLIPIAMPVLLNNICPGKHHAGYGISSGKLWKLRAAVNYALAAGKLVQVQRFCFRTGMAATLFGQVNRNLNIIDT